MKLVTENVGDILKPKTKEQVLDQINSMSKEELIKTISMLSNGNEEKAWDATKWLDDYKLINALIRTLVTNASHFTISDFIDEIINKLGESNNWNWEESYKQLLNELDENSLITIIEEI